MSRHRARRLPREFVRLPWWVALLLIGWLILLNAITSVRAYWVVPPVILPILPDGGYCEHPPLTDDHPGPDEVWALLQEPPTPYERREVEVVINGCKNKERAKIDPWRVLAALRLEEALGVPPRYRLLFPATLCIESGFSERPDLRGDQGAARGPFQLHPAWTTYCMDGKVWNQRSPAQFQELMKQDPRDSLVFSARCQITAMKRVMRTAKACGPDRAFEVAEAIVSRAPHKLNCYGRTSHAKLAETWRNQVRAL